MKLPFVSSSVVDVLIAALRSGGYLADDVSADKIRSAVGVMTETARDTLASELAYGSGGSGGGSRLSSADDVWVLLDTDNTNPTSPYTNYFSIIKGQNSIPATDGHNAVMSVGSQSDPYDVTTLTVGARLDQVSATDTDMESRIYLGFGGDGLNAYHHGYLYGNKTQLSLVANDYQTYGISASSMYAIYLRSDRKVVFANKSGMFSFVRGGFVDLGSTAKFCVGADLYTNASDHALAIEKPSDDSLRIYTSDTAAERQIYIMGSYSPFVDNACKWVQVAVGGQPAVTGQQPNNVPIEAADISASPSQLVDHKATFMVVSPNRGAVASCALQTWHRSTAVPDYTTLNNFHTSLNLNAASATIRLFSITGLNAGGLRTVVFAARGDRTTWALNLRASAYSTGGLDVAECFATDGVTNSYSPGTVMISTGAGKVVPSSGYASVAVVGVVSTKPGMTLNAECGLESQDDPSKDLKAPIAVAGTVPVRVTLSHGEIHLGDLLVSDEGGTAAKAPAEPAPGTILGKALEEWISPGEGKIKMLVLNR
jgi:hypothetical protein